LFDGNAYITSNQFPAHCSNFRGQINLVNGSDFDKALYSFALSAKARNKSIKYVVDDTQTICIIYGLLEVE
jgi:hypothetical protein